MNQKFLDNELNNVLNEKKSQSFNISITKKYIQKELNDLTSLEKEYKKQIEEAHKLPDDPSLGQDIFGDGILNENPTLKLTTLTSLNYTYGYIIGSIFTLENCLHYLEISEEDYKKELEKQKEIDEHNKLETEKIRNLIKQKYNEKKGS